jgi:hypothetical protein
MLKEHSSIRGGIVLGSRSADDLHSSAEAGKKGLLREVRHVIIIRNSTFLFLVTVRSIDYSTFSSIIMSTLKSRQYVLAIDPSQGF